MNKVGIPVIIILSIAFAMFSLEGCADFGFEQQVTENE